MCLFPSFSWKELKIKIRPIIQGNDDDDDDDDETFLHFIFVIVLIAIIIVIIKFSVDDD